MKWPELASLIIVVLVSYAIGSIPFSILTGRILKGIDIRTKGSGNAGATNAYRILGWKAAVFILLADFGKGFLPIFYAGPILSWMSGNIEIDSDFLLLIRILMLTAIVIGHAFPLWASFKGGKGVACSAGGLTALVPLAAPICLLIFILVVMLSSYVSLASLVTAWFLPLLYLAAPRFISGNDLSYLMLIFFLGVAILITVLHRKNIVRLFHGEEPRFRESVDKR